jgi:hypothetical protein
LIDGVFKEVHARSFLAFGFFERFGVPPDSAGVVFRACDYGVSFVVELAREDFVLVAL